MKLNVLKLNGLVVCRQYTYCMLKLLKVLEPDLLVSSGRRVCFGGTKGFSTPLNSTEDVFKRCQICSKSGWC